MATVTCTRKGCGQKFDPSANDDASCTFHPGAPVFHEGMKSWSCCQDKHRKAYTFDEFLAIAGCTTGTHSTEAPEPLPAPAATASAPAPSSTAAGVESYGLPPPPAIVKPSTPALADVPKPQSTAYVEEVDDPETPLAAGMSCKRKACKVSHDPALPRAEETCIYHPGAPIFHEGSKGWSCCKRRVMDFDDFLKIEGCKTRSGQSSGAHLFVGKKSVEVEMVDCRTDHYQTPTQVIVSVFGKQADKDKSTVVFEEETMTVTLHLPSNKQFHKTFPLYGPISPTTSTFKILGTKVEIVLAKADARSWPAIVKLEGAASNFVPQLAFSAGGGRGTVGGKDMVLDAGNKLTRGESS